MFVVFYLLDPHIVQKHTEQYKHIQKHVTEKQNHTQANKNVQKDAKGKLQTCKQALLVNKHSVFMLYHGPQLVNEQRPIGHVNDISRVLVSRSTLGREHTQHHNVASAYGRGSHINCNHNDNNDKAMSIQVSVSDLCITHKILDLARGPFLKFALSLVGGYTVALSQYGVLLTASLASVS